VRYAHDHANVLGLRITIADNGAGIAPENMSRIFEPFFSTKETKGTGLGLWVSQGIVQKHGGEIRLRSSKHTDHHGTCFVIFLPVGAAQLPRAVATSAAAAQQPAIQEATATNNDLTAA
jgi:signal transduction histidine kinase